MSYLFRHPTFGVYYFRRAVPKQLRLAVGKALIKESLGTKNLAEAKTLCLAKATEWDQKFREVEVRVAGLAQPRAELSEVEIARIADAHHHRTLADDEALRTEGLTKHDYDLIAQGLANIGGRQRHKFARGDIDGWQPIADAALAESGIALDRQSLSYRKLIMAIMKADIRAGEAMTKRHAGEPVDTPPAPPPASFATAVAPGGPGSRLSAVLKSYLAERNPPSTTRTDFTLAMNRFIQLHGDLDAGSVTKVQCRQFKEAVARIPKAMPAAQRKLPLPRLLEALDKKASRYKALAPGSINKALGAVHAMLEWGHSNGFIPSETWANPMRKLKVHDTADDKEARLPFSLDHLRLIFGSLPQVTQGAPDRAGGEAARWLPILALFSGARLEELGQATVADVREEDGLPYLDLNTIAEGSRLKRRASRRKLPLHPEVIRCGFLDYVTSRRRAGDERLFPRLEADSSGKRTKGWSKWFGEYLDTLDITDARLVFHSFRHSFKDATREVGMDDGVSNAIMGHSGGGEGKRYGKRNKGYPVRVLAAAMAKIEYRGLDLGALYVKARADAAAGQ